MVTIEITRRGIYQSDGMVPVGTRLELKQEPTAWRGKYRVVADDANKTLELATQTEPKHDIDLEILRSRYQHETGEEPDKRWGAKRLVQLIEEAQDGRNDYS